MRRWVAVVWVVAMVCYGCGGKRHVVKKEGVQKFTSDVKVETEVCSVLRVLELLECDYRRVEMRDSAGNEKVVTTAHLSKNSERAGSQEETRVERRKEEEGNRAIVEEEKERKSRSVWWWLIGVGMGVAGCIVGYVVWLKRK